MYLRFAVHDRDQRTDRGIGLFTILYRLDRAGRLAEYEAAWFEEQERWFNDNLAKPGPLTDPKAILWFKASAVEHVSRMRALAELLEHKDTHVEIIQSARPGYVIYEDDHQVAAVPFARETFA